MGTETKPTARASNPTIPYNKGIIGARRHELTTSWSSVTLPAAINRGYLKNSGSVDIAIRFNSDSGANQLYPLAPNESTGLLFFRDNTTISARVSSGTGEISAIFMS